MSTADLEAKYEADIRFEQKRMFVREVAGRRHAEFMAVREWQEPDDLGSLASMLTMEWPDDPYLITGVLPENGNAVLTAEFKTGKTTFLGNVVRSLVDGTDFLGAYPVTRTGSVALWNYELTARMQINWLRALEITNQDQVHPLHLRGRRMPLYGPAARRWVIAWLKAREVSTWIVDPWGPALAGVGGDENSNTDARKLLTTLDEIKVEAGVKELIIATHTGRGEQESGSEHARGATVLDDWPDARWVLTRAKGSDQRFVRFAGRLDQEIPETGLSYDPATRALTLIGGGDPFEGMDRRAVAQAVKLADYRAKVLTYITEFPGCSQAKIVKGTRIHEREIRAAVEGLETDGVIRTEIGPRSATLHFPTAVDGPVPPAGELGSVA